MAKQPWIEWFRTTMDECKIKNTEVARRSGIHRNTIASYRSGGEPINEPTRAAVDTAVRQIVEEIAMHALSSKVDRV